MQSWISSFSIFLMGIVISNTLILLVALIHVWIMYLEMVLWTKPKGLKTFRMTAQKAEDSKVLAFNQGLYNGFLALALIWGVIGAKPDLQLYGLACVFFAGVVGALTVGKQIFFVQSVPALLALIAFWNLYQS